MNQHQELPLEITIGDKYGPAMQITSQEEADLYFELCVQHSISLGNNRQEAIEIEKSNLGYYAGYYDPETRLRVERLFRAKHPFFGSAKNSITNEEAFELGLKEGKRQANQS